MWPIPFDDAWPGRRGLPTSGPDLRLARQVMERIIQDSRLDGEDISVEVQNRVVNLFGTVTSLHARVIAADLARSTPGVTDICNRLTLARSADVPAVTEDLRPDPFDSLVARWEDEPVHPGSTHRDRSAMWKLLTAHPEPGTRRRLTTDLICTPSAFVALAGLWTMLTPLVVEGLPAYAGWNGAATGLAVTALGALRVLAPRRTAPLSLVIVTLGGWLVAAPFAWGVAHLMSYAWNSILVGTLVILFAGVDAAAVILARVRR